MRDAEDLHFRDAVLNPGTMAPDAVLAFLPELLLRAAPSVRIAPHASAEIFHVRGRGTVEEPRIRTGTPLPSSSVSSHDCVGDMSTVKPRASRVCVFRRVCLSTVTGDFLYYRDGNATLAPVVFDQRYGHIFSFGHVAPKGGREELLPLNKHVRYKRHVRWSPHMVDGPMPSHAPLLEPLHLLSAPFVPTNLGHLVWEEVRVNASECVCMRLMASLSAPRVGRGASVCVSECV